MIFFGSFDSMLISQFFFDFLHLFDVVFIKKFLIFRINHFLFLSVSLESLFFILKKSFEFFLGLILLDPSYWFSIIDPVVGLISFPLSQE